MLNPTIQIIPLADYPLDKLEQEWNSLFNRSAGCFFLSWNWIGSWLSILPTFDDVYVVQASVKKSSGKHSSGTKHSSCSNGTGDSREVVGFGIFCQRTIRRHGFVKSKQWHLHRTGNDKLDQIWIEYNDFLLANEAAETMSNEQLRGSIWQSLLTSQPLSASVDEFVVNVAEVTPYKALQQSAFCQKVAPDFTLTLDSEQLGFKVALNHPDLLNYPQSLSKSSFKQINKSRTELLKIGDLEIGAVTDSSEIMTYLATAQSWHIKKWANTDTPSGFCNDAFVGFHQSLCKQGDVVCIVARLNGHIIGLNYLFIDKTSAYFYLSCLKPQNNNRIKLGLLLHQESVNYAKARQLNCYDFLAGPSRYKQQLSNLSTPFARCIYQRKKMCFAIESILVSAKSFLVRKCSPQMV